MAQAQNFYLEELNIIVEAEKALLHGGESTTSFDASANATLDIPVSYARRLMQYQADALDVNDLNASDIKFRMFHKTADNGDITSASNNLKYFNTKNVIPAQASVDSIGGTEGPIGFYGSAAQNANEQKVDADFVRHVAKSVFGVPVTDLFSNERVVRNDINKDSADNFVAKIGELVDFRVDYTGEANAYVRINTTEAMLDGSVADPADMTAKATNFPARLVFSQLVSSTPERFVDLNTLIDPQNSSDASNNLLHLYDESDATETEANLGNNLWRYMPLMVGDSIHFKLTVNPHDEQEQVTTLGNAAGTDVPSRTYKIKLNMVADDASSVDSTSNEESMTNFWRAWDQAGWDSSVPLHHLNDTANAAVGPDASGNILA